MIAGDVWPNRTTGKLLVFGYPTSFQNLQIDEQTGRLCGFDQKAVVVGGRYIRASNARGIHEISMERKTDFNPDGMSGGAVFHLGEDASGFFLGFAGMLMRGGSSSNSLRMFDAETVLFFLKRFMKK